MPAFFAQVGGQLQNRGDARRIVVGAGVDLALFLFALARAGRFAVAEMIVVGAQHHELSGGVGAAGRRQIAQHVAIGPFDALDRGGDSHLQLRDQKTAFRVRVFGVERGLQRFQIPAAAGEQGFRNVRADGSGEDV